MLIEWLEDGLMLEPENDAETDFLDGLQDLFSAVRVKLEANPLTPDAKQHLLSRVKERIRLDSLDAQA